MPPIENPPPPERKTFWQKKAEQQVKESKSLHTYALLDHLKEREARMNRSWDARLERNNPGLYKQLNDAIDAYLTGKLHGHVASIRDLYDAIRKKWTRRRLPVKPSAFYRYVNDRREVLEQMQREAAQQQVSQPPAGPAQ